MINAGTSLPSGAVLSSCSYTTSSSNIKTCTVTFRWTPELGQKDTVFCLQATDGKDGGTTTGAYCIQLRKAEFSYIYASGILRDFTPASSDFDRADGDSNVALVQNTLGSDGKPVYTGAGSTIASTSSFNDWWNTNGVTNEERVVTLTLVKDISENVFNFDSTAFYPVDNLLLGNSGDDHNNFFTYELNAYITYEGGEELNFKSGDDMWIFLNDQLVLDMGGVHASESGILRLDSLGLIQGDSYKLSLFYAHRSSTRSPALTVELLEDTSCNALTSGEETIGIDTFTSSSPVYTTGMAHISNNLLYIAAAAESTSGAAWFATTSSGITTPQPQNILNGFSLRFKFLIDPAATEAEGFAVVLQDSGINARGDGGASLGYGGSAGIFKSIAIEFDTAQQTANDDPAFHHVAIQTQQENRNSADHGSSLTGVSDDATLNLISANYQDVEITYSPGDPGWLRVFINGEAKPLAQRIFSAEDMSKTFPSRNALVGFTASSSSTRLADITIDDWHFDVVPPSPTFTAASSPPGSIEAGETGSFTIRTRDTCNNLLQAGGEGSKIKVEVTRVVGADVVLAPYLSFSNPIDNGDGSYEIQYSLTEAGQYEVHVYFDEIELNASPYSIDVLPREASASNSYFVHGLFTESPTNVQSAYNGQGIVLYAINKNTGAVSLALTGYDTEVKSSRTALKAAVDGLSSADVVVAIVARQLGVDAPTTEMKGVFSALGSTSFAALSRYSSWAFIGGVDGTKYAESVSSAYPGTALISHKFTSAGVELLAASGSTTHQYKAYIQHSLIANEVNVGTQVSLTVIARDVYNNFDTRSLALAISPSFSPTLSGATVTQVANSPYSTIKWSTLVSASYSLNVLLGGVALTGSGHITVVNAGKTDADKSALSGSGLSSATAGQSSSFVLTPRDVYGNILSQAHADDVISATMVSNSGTSPVTVSVSFSAAQKQYIFTYVPSTVTSYTISVVINGVTVVGSTQTFVFAGPENAARSTAATLASASVGKQAQFTVTSRDSENNDRTSPNVTPFTVEFSDTISSSISYAGDGKYVVLFTPLTVGSLDVSVKLGSTIIGAGTPMSVAISAGDVSEKSELGGYSNGVVGTHTFTVKAIDIGGNDLTGDADSAEFGVDIISTAGHVGVEDSGSRTGVAGTYTFTWTAEIADTYNINVYVGSDKIVGSGAAVTLAAGAASASRCVIDPPPPWSGIQETVRSFTIISKDSFGNLIGGSSDSFSVKLTEAGVTETFADIIPNNDGTYLANYTIPEGAGDFTELLFEVFLTNSGSVLIQDSDETIIPSATKKCALASGAGLTSARAGEENTITVVNRDCTLFEPIECTEGCDDVTATISNAAGVSIPSVVTYTNNVYTITYTPEILGTYSVRILVNRNIETEQSKDESLALTVTAGSVDHSKSTIIGLPSEIQAGQTGSFTINLKDSFGNAVTDESSFVVTMSEPDSSNDDVTIESQSLVGSVVTVVYSATKASGLSSKRVRVQEGGQTIGNARYNVRVLPATPSATGSTVSVSFDTSRPILAGQNIFLNLQVRDQFENKVLGNSVNASLSIKDGAGDDPDYTASTVVVPSIQSNQYIYESIEIRETGTFFLVVKMDDVEVESIEITVVPGSLSEEESTLDSATGTTAGGNLVVEISLRDGYGNAWEDDADVVILSVRTASSQKEMSDISLGGGRYRGTLSGIEESGVYLITVKSTTGVSFSTPYEVTVSAASADVSQSEIVAAVTGATAGNSINGYVVLKDRFGNTVTAATTVFLLVYDGIYTEGDTNECDEDRERIKSDPTSLSTDIDDADSNGHRTFTILQTKAGTYSLSLYVGGSELACEEFVVFSVSAGDIDAQRSQVLGKVNSARAGAVQWSQIIFRDVYNNTIDTLFEKPPLFNYSFVSQNPQSGDPGLGDVLDVSTKMNANGTLSLYFAITFTRTYLVSYLYNDQLIGGETFGSVQVSPGAMSTFEIVGNDNDVLKFTVGEVSTFQLQVQDVYNNSAECPNGICAHSYSVIFREGQFSFSASVAYDQGIFHNVTVLPKKAGVYTMEINLFDGVSASPRTRNYKNMRVNHTLCANEDPNKPFRCPVSRVCVATPAACVETVTQCTTDTPRLCADGSCTGLNETCPCSDVTHSRCDAGHCSANCLQAQPCPISAPYNCRSQAAEDGKVASPVCRASADGCPSLSVCPVGYVQCEDGVSCAFKAEECVAPVVKAGCEYTCPNGACVSRFEDCPTPTTCSNAGESVCPNGRCINTANGETCEAPNQCSDGKILCPNAVTCASSAADCPTAVSCPVGWVKCEHGKCAPTVSSCSAPQVCEFSKVQCPDGSCQESYFMCPSGVSCPLDSPVLCSDGACKTSLGECSTPSFCDPAAGFLTCPDGTCVSTFAHCPTRKRCPSDYPVLCPNKDCAQSVYNCSLQQTCPDSAPLLCPDGSCRGNIIDCPSQTACGNNLVRCADFSCVFTDDECKPYSSIQCSSGVRCPGGECSASVSTCPTHITCPQGFQKCNDGTCRKDCSAIDNAGTSSDDDDDSVVGTCLEGQIRCPISGYGVFCVDNDISECPSGFRCPASAPVRCLDQQCATTITNCPAPPDNYVEAACADGGFEVSLESCGTPVTCPALAPYSCYDQTCRKNPKDCPAPPTCGSGQYLCVDGSCQTSLDRCNSPEGKCDDDRPIRCWSGDCEASINDCPTIFQEEFDCPYGWLRCRDGACKKNSINCKALECPTHLPHLCTDGMCATDSSKCNNVITGCPYDIPFKCWDGSCTNSTDSCSAAQSCTNVERPLRCPDGSCQNNVGDCPQQNGCSSGEVRCLDGTCQLDSSSGDNPCTGPLRDTNQCPSTRPVKCPRGYCAVTSALCPPPLDSTTGQVCSNTRPIRCDDGSCVFSAEQCPVIAPCTEETVRCGDGSCRDSLDDCPSTDTCPKDLVRCSGSANGLCATGLSQCTNELTGCRSGLIRCEETNACIDPDLFDSCDDVTVDETPQNGCSATSPIKCVDGSCVSSQQSCLTSDGCAVSSPFKCTDGSCSPALDTSCTNEAVVCSDKCADGLCVNSTTITQCRSWNFCPATAPIRCADGNCRALTAKFAGRGLDSCDITVTCTDAEVRCGDASCASSLGFCPPFEPCAKVSPYRCADGVTCATSPENCPSMSVCPSSHPVTCPSGDCKASVTECPGQKHKSCASTRTECFDGSCLTSTRECIQWSARIRGKSIASVMSVNIDTLVCGSGTVCPDGSCAPDDGSSCDSVSACSADTPYRCTSICTATAEECETYEDDSNFARCPSGTSRCEDGFCRSACLPYDGCPFHTYHCAATDTCVKDESKCAGYVAPLSVGAGSTARQLLAVVEGLDPTNHTFFCTEECNRQVKATTVTYTVDSRQSNSIDIATDSNRVIVGKLEVPSGALVKIIPNDFDNTSLVIQPVADSQLREASNPVTSTRRSEWGSQLDFAHTVLSAAFECILDANIVQPLVIPITYEAEIDLDTNPGDRDSCLGFIEDDKWRCVETNRTIRDTSFIFSDDRARQIVRGSLFVCEEGRYYAFINVPNANEVSSSQSWIEKNWQIILIVIVCLGIFTALLFYTYTRLYRYRKKYHLERDKVEEMRAKVEDMEQFGTGLQDPDVDMMANPLAVQIKDASGRHGMQETMEGMPRNSTAERKAEERQERMAQLREDKARMESELEKMKQELQFRREEEPTIPAAGPSAAAAPEGPSPSPQARQGQFGAQRPKRRDI